MSAVVHVASNVTFHPDPNKVIPAKVDGALNALRAANMEPSVKRYVLTSSSFAAHLPKPNKKGVVTKDTWNDESVKIAQQDPPYLPGRASHNYAASKALAEREVWKFYRENETRRLGLIANTGRKLVAIAETKSDFHSATKRKFWKESRFGQPRTPINFKVC